MGTSPSPPGASPAGLRVFVKSSKRGCLPGCRRGLQALEKLQFNILAKLSVFSKNSRSF